MKILFCMVFCLFALPVSSQSVVTTADLAFLNGHEKEFFQALAGKTAVKEAVVGLIKDPELIKQDNPPGPDHIVCFRGKAGEYAFIYSPAGITLQLNTQQFKSETLQLGWYNPKQNSFGRKAQLPPEPMMAFKPPTQGSPWVLMIRLQ